MPQSVRINSRRSGSDSWKISVRPDVRVLKLMLPAVGSILADRQFSRVDLPEPDSPTMPRTSPG